MGSGPTWTVSAFTKAFAGFPAQRASSSGEILSVVSTFDPLVTLKLSVQRALLGEVTDRLFCVTCGIHGKTVQIRAYFFGKVTPNDIERVSARVNDLETHAHGI
jgi:hypothetical protein